MRLHAVGSYYAFLHRAADSHFKNISLVIMMKKMDGPRPFNYMFFTPLNGVRNTGCPQISTKKCPQIP
jgi:hypothetical protein